MNYRLRLQLSGRENLSLDNDDDICHNWTLNLSPGYSWDYCLGGFLVDISIYSNLRLSPQDGVSRARRRIVLASLYIGTTAMERQLVSLNTKVNFIKALHLR